MRSNFTHYSINKIKTFLFLFYTTAFLVFSVHKADGQTSLPFTENFDGLPSYAPYVSASPATLPSGWSVTNITPGSSLTWNAVSGSQYSPSTTPHSGTGMMVCDAYSCCSFPSPSSADLATPQLHFGGSPGNPVTIQVSYWMTQDQPSYQLPQEGTTVYISSDSTSAGGSSLGFTPRSNTSVTPTYTGVWTHVSSIINTELSSGYIIFEGTSLYGNNFYVDDVSINVIPPCTGMPSGQVSYVLPCYSSTFTLYYTDSLQGGLSYQWQTSPDSINWISTGDTLASLTTSITAPTYFRVIVHCQASGMTDTTGHIVNLAPFYNCYCMDSTEMYTYNNANIGNVSIKKANSNAIVLDNGVAYPLMNNPNALNNYTDYRYLTPAQLYTDSAYKFSITQIENSTSFTPSTANIYIDMNHNGIYEPAELVLDGATVSDTMPYVADTFVVPQTAMQGNTGMRVILQPGGTTPIDPCLANNYGEVEDYTVNINYAPCTGYASAGTAHVTDTNLCPNLGYTFTLIDTTHDSTTTGLIWNWMVSLDNGATWGVESNSTNMSMLTLPYTGPVTYRLRMICSNSHDTTYSNTVHIGNDPDQGCYCYSAAIGGVQWDTCDVGAFSIDHYLFVSNNYSDNPHLLNQFAIRSHTDHSLEVMDLSIDSTYPVMAYQILKSATHANASVALYIDYNNDKVYEVPDERVWTATSTSTNFYLTGNVTIPHNVIVGTVTGARLIMSDDPNAPMNPCGTYVSGETEEYGIRFHDSTTLSVNNISNLHDVALYPNPTSGKFNIQFTSGYVKDLQITVSNMTGQQVLVSKYENTSGQFSHQLDLSNQPRGIYFVEIMADGIRTVKKLTVE